ncbi:MAG: carbohydrate-binding family 9-like protein, partial [Armatimonadota bacterium]
MAFATAAALLVAAGAAPAQLLEEVRFVRAQPPAAAVPQAERLRFAPPRAERPPVLDGRLDEAVWEQPDAYLGAFRLGLSATPARHAREAWAAYDDEHLYLAVRLEREPGTELRVFTLEDDDSAVWEDDEVELFVDPFSSGSEYFQMIVNSAGVLYDAHHLVVQVPDPGGAGPGEMKLERVSDDAWSSGLRRAVSIEDKQWIVEMALPLASVGLAGAPAGHELGVNLTSADWDTEEYTCLSPTSDWHDPRQFGVLRLGEPHLAIDEIDLEGVGPGRNL